jgi:uncharacterized protein involved in exopolysaccharide biosynthesis
VGESNQDISRGSFYQSWNVFRNDQLPDEVHMITAGPVLAAAIDRLHLTDDQVYHSFFGYAGVLWQKSWPGRAWRATKDFLFPPARTKYTLTPEQKERAKTLTDLRNGVSLERVMESNLGNLSVRGPTMDVADIANTIIAVYLEQRRARHVREADDAYQALAREADSAQAEIGALEDRMRKYYQDNGILLSFEKDKIDIGNMQAMKASIEDLQAGIASNEEVLRALQSELAAESRYVVSTRVTGINQLHVSLQSRLNDLEIGRKQTLMHYRPDSPEIAEIDRQIAIVTEAMKKEPAEQQQQDTEVMSSQYATLRARAAEIRVTLAGQHAALDAKTATYNAYRDLVASLPQKMREVHDMDRMHDAAEKKFAAIQEKMMVAAVSRASAMSDSASIRVVEAAAPPNEANWPRTKLLLGAALGIGLIAGVLLALLMDLFKGRVHRFRLAGEGELELYATVRTDHGFVADLFGLPMLPVGDARLLWLE